MRKWLADKMIHDEYGDKVPHKEFWDLVKSKQKKQNLNHAKLYPREGEEYVIGGYSFSDRYFS